MDATPQSWSDLPADLATLVGRLYSHADRVRFAAVCPQWRRSATRQARLPPSPPLLALKDGGTFYSMPGGEPLRFAGCDEHFATASSSWLVYLRVYCLVLVDPFSGATMTLPDPSSTRGSEDEGVYEDGYDSSSESHLNWIVTHDFQVMKLIVCSPDLVAALFWSSSRYQVAVCRPGGSTWSVAWNLSLWITDIVFYQGKLFSVDYHEELLALDISVDSKTGDPQVSQIGQAIKANHFDILKAFNRMVYLVESCGKLLLVRRMIFHRYTDARGQIHTFDGQCEPELAVFKADFGRSRWARVTSVEDDQALFLGPCSRAVCLPQYDSPGNRVWFLDDYKDYYCPSNDSSTSGTSDMANGMFSTPLPMISWSGPADQFGAAWLFPSN
ncbi:unnamed protein product [Urochloa decumbens]|uniref:KIB1-4 beta-propeller domain-containing protein n=1 Tax=Urochloa decumbens TaxID=240449 RepID=A0ABC9B1Z9_9POAL